MATLRIDDIPEDQIVFYDIETDSQFAPYCELRMIAYQRGLYNLPKLVEDVKEFRELMRDPNIIKVSYNGINFDDIVLWRHGIFVEPRNRHDMYLALKTVAPTLPSYGLKFANWYYFGDWHEPERLLDRWCNIHKAKMWDAPKELLANYCMYDVIQTANIFRMIWEVVQRPLHWNTYRRLELAMGEPLHEMILHGGEFLSIPKIEEEIVRLEVERSEWNERGCEIAVASGGSRLNLGSTRQVAWHLREIDKFELELSAKNNFLVRKADLLYFVKKGPQANAPRFAGRKLSEKEVWSRKGRGFDNEATKDVLTDEDEHSKTVAGCAYEYRDITKVIGYLRSYLRAARHEVERREQRSNRDFCERANRNVRNGDSTRSVQESGSRYSHSNSKTNKSSYSPTGERIGELIKIPKGYSLSAARTRRFLSSSKYGINFQNQNKRSKSVQMVPPGWLGCWIDSSQIENIVHIWASGDEERREAYEKDIDWSEYVWLCNQIQGGNRTKEELDKIVSPVNPAWSVYKQFKTCKLALNFGMGIDKFAKTTGVSRQIAKKMFDQVHKACPAIKRLQDIVRRKIVEDKFIQDPFGHIYSGNPKEAYKIVAYLVQGCGTGSVPKAMTIANYETLHSCDSDNPIYWPNVRHRYKRTYAYAVLVGTTHDECAFRISLGLPTEEIIRMIRECMYNMEERFSKKFGGIPLRAKFAVSYTNAGEQKELNHHAEDFEQMLIRDYINEGRNKAGKLVRGFELVTNTK